MDEVKIISDKIKELFEKDSGGHDYFHTMRVYQNALKIAEEEECDIRAVALTALLHDVDDVKLFHTENYANARKLLAECKIPAETAEEIIHNISQISFKGKDSKVPDTIEGKIVQDADRLDALGAIGIARTFAYGGSRGKCMYNPKVPPNFSLTEKDYPIYEGTSVNHFYEKLFLLKDLMNTETGKRIAAERDAFMHSFMDEFLNEWNGL